MIIQGFTPILNCVFLLIKGKRGKPTKFLWQGMLVFNKNVGFFEDKYIIFEGILFRGGGDEQWWRIMVGEFQKLKQFNIEY